jgi:hypothetical protein
MQENRNHVRPAPRFRDRLETELSIKNVQITLRRNDEHSVGPDEQSLSDQFDRHLRVARKNFVEQSGGRPQVIDDDDPNAHVGRQVSQ